MLSSTSIARLRPAGQLGVGERPHGRPRDGDLELGRSPPFAPDGAHRAAPPPDHCRRLARGTRHNPPSRLPQALSSIGDGLCVRAVGGVGDVEAEDRASAQPRRLPAVGAPVPDRRPDPRRRARLPRDVRRVQADVRARQGRTARARHPAGDRDEPGQRRGGRLPDLAAGLRAARDQARAGRGGSARARRAGSGGGPNWPARRPAACSSCARPVSTPRRRPSRGSSRGCRPAMRRSARCGRRSGTGGR